MHIVGAVLSFTVSVILWIIGLAKMFADEGKWSDERALIGPIVGTGLIAAAIVAVLFGIACLSRVPPDRRPPRA